MVPFFIQKGSSGRQKKRTLPKEGYPHPPGEKDYKKKGSFL